jgi:hypothetical protein
VGASLIAALGYRVTLLIIAAVMTLAAGYLASRRAQGTKLGSLAGLSRGQHAKLTAIGIGHSHPAGLALADVDASRTEGDQTVDLLLLITVNGWSEVEM